MPIITPNFNFSGTCEEAIQLYCRAFDAEIGCMLRNSDANPADYSCGPDDERAQEIYHAELFIGGQRIMMCDNHDVPHAPSTALSLTVTLDSREEVLRAFEVLGEGATIIYPPHSTSYSSCTVTLIDRFGFRWGVMTEQAER